MIIVLLASLAFSASDTELPPPLRADLSIGHQFEATYLRFEQAGMREIGSRRDVQHITRFDAEFSLVRGIAATFGIEGAAHRAVTHLDSRQMTGNTSIGLGSYVDSPALAEPPRFQGSGVRGVWLGAAFQPFSEEFDKNHPVTWRLDFAYRTRPSRSFFEVDEEQRRGAGEAGETFRIAGAFSRERYAASPYVRVEYQFTTPRSFSVPSANAPSQATQFRVEPGHRVDVITGTELKLSDPNAERGSAEFDVHTGFGYQTKQVGPSGIYLPSVASGSEYSEVERPERLGVHLGGAFEVEVIDEVELRTWVRAFWALPWRIEQPYTVYSSLDTISVVTGADVTVRIR